MRGNILIILCLIFSSCAGVQHPKSEARLEKGGEAYCKAYLANDTAQKKEVVKKYQLHAEYWEIYCHAMKARNYTKAFAFARELKLGARAMKEAGIKEIWNFFDSGHIYGAHLMSKTLKMSVEEKKSLAEIALSLKLQNQKCDEAISIVNIFDLAPKSAEGALSCIAKKNGLTKALRTTCVYPKYERFSRVYKKLFLENLSHEYQMESEWNDFRKTIQQCRWAKAEFETLYQFLKKEGDTDTSVHVLQKMQKYLSKNELLTRARELFDDALTDVDTKNFLGIYKAFPEVLDDVRKPLLLKKYIKSRRCAEALFFAHTQKYSEKKMSEIFSAPRCVMSDFERFEWEFAWNNNAPLERYFHLAIKHQSFVFARRLADRLTNHTKKDYDYFGHLTKSAFRVKAHALLLMMPPPPGEESQTYKERIFEDALVNKEEWTAATFARGHHSNPKSIIERAYLSAVERGEFILAVQIAKTYGQSSKIARRGILAFEMAMIARRPQDAQFIMHLIGLVDSARQNRAAVLRFKIRQQNQRNDLRIKRKKARKEKRKSGEWSVRR